MITLLVTFDGGTSIVDAAEEAQALAERLNVNVEFDFNNITCRAIVGGARNTLVEQYHDAITARVSHKARGSYMAFSA